MSTNTLSTFSALKCGHQQTHSCHHCARQTNQAVQQNPVLHRTNSGMGGAGAKGMAAQKAGAKLNSLRQQLNQLQVALANLDYTGRD